MSYKAPRTCANPRCAEELHTWSPLCPSCRYAGQLGMLIGAAIVGALMRVFK